MRDGEEHIYGKNLWDKMKGLDAQRAKIKESPLFKDWAEFSNTDNRKMDWKNCYDVTRLFDSAMFGTLNPDGRWCASKANSGVSITGKNTKYHRCKNCPEEHKCFPEKYRGHDESYILTNHNKSGRIN